MTKSQSSSSPWPVLILAGAVFAGGGFFLVRHLRHAAPGAPAAEQRRESKPDMATSQSSRVEVERRFGELNDEGARLAKAGQYAAAAEAYRKALAASDENPNVIGARSWGALYSLGRSLT